MTLLLLAALAITVWSWRKGALRALRFGDVAAVVAALIAAGFLRRGETVPALIGFAGAGLWAWRRGRRGDPPASVDPQAAAEAHALLELPADADAEMIRAAHRRLIARVHPDAGGSAELARRVNDARDTLLAAIAAEPDSRGRVSRRS